MPVLDHPRHELFAQHLAKGKTQQDSAIAAGYKESSADRISSRLVRKSEIRERVNEIQGRIAERVAYDAARVLERLAELVELQISDFDKPMSEWTPAMKRWAEVEDVMERSTDGVQAGESKSWDKVGIRVKITNRDKLKALELIGRLKKVDAFVAQKHEVDLTLHASQELTAALAAGRSRAMLPAPLEAETDNVSAEPSPEVIDVQAIEPGKE